MNSKVTARVVRNLAISLAAATVTPAFLYLLAEGPPTAGFLARVFLESATYAMAITFLADALLHPLGVCVQHLSEIVQWTILVIALVAVSTIGFGVGTAVIVVANILFRGNMLLGPSFFGYVWKLCVFITVVFGLVIATYERLQDRLATAELKLRTEELEHERAIKLAAEARLAALEAQLHPHFLFNSLNSVSALIASDPVRAERLVERIATLLRFSLEAQRSGLVQLEQELKVVRDYLEIEHARLGSRLRYRIEFGGEVKEASVPPLSVQTLVENSVKFAIAPNRDGGEVLVRTHRNNGCIYIDVADTGPGFNLETIPYGHGLDNLRSRLSVLFGPAAALNVVRSEGWTRVTIKAPL